MVMSKFSRRFVVFASKTYAGEVVDAGDERNDEYGEKEEERKERKTRNRFQNIISITNKKYKPSKPARTTVVVVHAHVSWPSHLRPVDRP